MMTRESCLIHFMDGTQMSFYFDIDTEDTFSVANEIHRFADRTVLCFEIDGRLHFFPTCNIRSIEVSPAPLELPANVLRGGKIIKD
ncbi:MAG: hypothetical protein KC900_08215 [Candidatus Omnitrophica bacterium]|nr:hypothetical protein [Candidatus Omnitrophota bacterium]